MKKYLKALKDNWKASWETKKLKNSYVGSKGWKDFHRELVKTIRKDIGVRSTLFTGVIGKKVGPIQMRTAEFGMRIAEAGI